MYPTFCLSRMLNVDSVTHACVKFKEETEPKYLAIEQISEFKIVPKNKLDFKKKCWYTAYWQDDRNPDGVVCEVQIAELICKY